MDSVKHVVGQLRFFDDGENVGAAMFNRRRRWRSDPVPFSGIEGIDRDIGRMCHL
jgi:hypothetical protein